VANVYVRSGAAGAGTGADWANAHTTLEAALAVKAAGDDFWVAGDHAETKASALTLACPGTGASPCRIICVNHAGTVPPVSADLRTTATIATTGSSTLTYTGTFYAYGIGNQRNTSAANQQIVLAGNAGDYQVWERSSHTLNSTGATAKIALGSSNGGQRVVFINTTVGFGAVGQQLQIGCRAEWLDTTSAITGTIPTTLILFATLGNLTIRGVDLSAAGSGKNLVDLSTSNTGALRAIDCKTHASVTLTTGSIVGPGNCVAEFVNYGSGATNYQNYYQDYAGTIIHETTIVRTSGASDGTTSISRKLVSTANSKFYAPLKLGPLVMWNESTSSLTVTVHVVTDNVTLTDAECWIEVEELGTSGYPLAVTQSDRAADILATPANQSTSTEAWTTTGLTTPVYQKLHVTFTPASKGPIKVRVMLAKPSTTVYVCPKVEVS